MASSVEITLIDDRVNIQQKMAAVDLAPSGSHIDEGVLTIGTAEETQTIHTDITGGNGPGMMFVRNLDATNYVELGIATGSYTFRFDGGWLFPFPLASAITTLYWKANTAPVKVYYKIWER